MIRGLKFAWHLSKSRFAQALAACRSYPVLRGHAEAWAAYRLGLYRTVVEGREMAGGDWRGGFAAAVSLAACGRAEEAERHAKALVASGRLGAQRAPLADALAPFVPELAVELLQDCEAPAALQAALLLRVGEREAAAGVLKRAFAAERGKLDPQLHLLMSNAVSLTPLQQLSRVNAFLGAYGLAPLALQGEAQAPGPMNLRPAEMLPPAHGPLVSVLMTAYRTGDRIRHAITSLLEQTYRDIEVIVVDDASDDETGAVVQTLAAADQRVVYLRLPCNVGTYVAKNIALRHASGEFVTCHDSDDWSHPLRIQRQVAPLLQYPRLIFTTSHWVRMQDDGIFYARPVHPLMRMNPASPLFRREAVLRFAGGWDPVRTGADSEFLARLRLVFGRRAMLRVAEPLAFGAHRPNSLMTAMDTGYSQAGMSPTRLDYWESWGHWHIRELRAGRKPRIPPDLSAERRFTAPGSILVDRSRIEACMVSAISRSGAVG